MVLTLTMQHSLRNGCMHIDRKTCGIKCYSNGRYTMKLLGALLISLVCTMPASAQTLTISHSDWHHQPILKRYIKTVEIQYIPSSPITEDGMTMEPVGYIERLYCNMDPNYSSRCSNADGEKWDLITEFFSMGSRSYSVRHSSGRPISGTADEKQDIPYGINAQSYYVTTSDKEESSGNLMRVEASVNNTVHASGIVIKSP